MIKDTLLLVSLSITVSEVGSALDWCAFSLERFCQRHDAESVVLVALAVLVFYAVLVLTSCSFVCRIHL